MSSVGPVARWLDTFFCKQYADMFKKFGYNTLNEVCKLDSNQLFKMGIASLDCERILENVSVLRQTLQAGSNNKSTYSSNMNITSNIQLDGINKVDAILPTNPKTGRKTKSTKSNVDKQQKQLVPNVTINQANGTQSPNSIAKQHSPAANPENAKKIGNEIMLMANQASQAANTKYTCLPINNSQNNTYNNNSYDYSYQQQQQQQPNQQYRNMQQSSVLLSPVSNPPSFSNNTYQQQQQQQYQYNSNQNVYLNNNTSSNWNSPNDFSYNSQYQHQQIHHHHHHHHQQQQQQQTFESSNYLTAANSKNSPLEYLERLVLLPESQTINDPRRVVNNGEETPTPTPATDLNATNKRGLILNESDLNAKKLCTSSSSSSSDSSSPSSNKQQQQFLLNNNNLRNSNIIAHLNDSSPTSSSSCSSSSSFAIMSQSLNNSTNNILTGISINQDENSTSNSASVNIIDASNFDFLDYLPELNSNTIDQAINNNNNNNKNGIQLDTLISGSSSSSSSRSSDSTSLDNIYLDLTNKFNTNELIPFDSSTNQFSLSNNKNVYENF